MCKIFKLGVFVFLLFIVSFVGGGGIILCVGFGVGIVFNVGDFLIVILLVVGECVFWI